MKLFRLWFTVCLVAALFAPMRSANAHPMGNFSINHYARFEAQQGELRLHYILDFAEIPTIDQMAKLDANRNDVVSVAEKNAYLQSVVPQLLSNLSLQIDGKKVALNARASDLQVIFGAGNLATLLVKIDTATPLAEGANTSVVYRDSNFADRTGWKEIIAVADKSLALANSDAATTDQSRGLTVFPIDAGVVPPRQDSAHFSVVAAGAQGASPAPTEANNAQTPAPDGNSNRNTPQNRFTQSIAEKTLTPTVIIWGLLIALAFGAVHALAPGHGKTMVAAYLVGSRGTPRHAVTLGLIVTITHTFGVFALGFALLLASRYFVAEKLYPVLSALSGLMIFGVGLWLFMSRYQGLQNGHAHSHDSHTHDHGEHSHDEHDHSHAHDEGHAHSHGAHSHTHDDEEHAHSHDEEHTHAHAHDNEGHPHSHGAHSHIHAHDEDEHIHAHDDEEHTHVHESHSHSHDEHDHAHVHDSHPHSHDHGHSHGAHVHSHGGKAHSHAVPDGPITTKTLVALGVSGGIVPCPEAIVVLLAAVKMHRIGYGMILIVAFSIGLAAALIAIGLLVVSARNRMSRLSALNEDSALVRYLPLASAAIITLIGAILTLQATLGRV